MLRVLDMEELDESIVEVMIMVELSVLEELDVSVLDELDASMLE